MRGRKLANFLAAASMDEAAPNNSFSAMTVGSSGSSQSVPAPAHRRKKKSHVRQHETVKPK
jgi:hypothetical protein